MKFVIGNKPEQTEQPLNVYLEVDGDGDVVLAVTDGTTTANIGFLSASVQKFRLFSYDENRIALQRLGFEVNGNEIAG